MSVSLTGRSLAESSSGGESGVGAGSEGSVCGGVGYGVRKGVESVGWGGQRGRATGPAAAVRHAAPGSMGLSSGGGVQAYGILQGAMEARRNRTGRSCVESEVYEERDGGEWDEADGDHWDVSSAQHNGYVRVFGEEDDDKDDNHPSCSPLLIQQISAW